MSLIRVRSIFEKTGMNENSKLILISLLFSVIAALLHSVLWFGIIGLLLILLIHPSPSKNIILLSIFLFIVISRDISDLLRTILNAVTILALFYYFFRKFGMNFSSYPKLQRNIFHFIIFLITIMVLSSWFSADKITGMLSTVRQITFFCLWYILFSYLNDFSDVLKYTGALVAAGFAIGIAITFSFFSSNTNLFLLESQGLVHEGGMFSNVTAAGGIFDVTIPLNIIFIMISDQSKKIKYSLIAILIVQFLGLFFTNSRESILAVFISMSIIYFILKRKLFYRVFFSGAVLFAIVFISSPLISNLFDLYFRVNRIMENTRYFLWDMTVKIIKDNPVWGVGPGQFKSQMYNHVNAMLGSWQEQQLRWVYESSGMGESHDFLLFRTAELGIFGFISALLLPILFIYYCLKVMKSYKLNQKIYTLVVGILALGIGLFIRSVFESTGLISHGWISRDLPFWICFCIILFLDSRKAELNVGKTDGF